MEGKQTDVREYLRRNQKVLSLHMERAKAQREIEAPEDFLDIMVMKLIECHASVLRRPTSAYLEILECLKSTALRYYQSLSNSKRYDSALSRGRTDLLSRLEFQKDESLE